MILHCASSCVPDSRAKCLGAPAHGLHVANSELAAGGRGGGGWGVGKTTPQRKKRGRFIGSHMIMLGAGCSMYHV